MMHSDHALSDIDLSPETTRKLAELEIRSVRQLYARLQQDAGNLQKYLRLSPEDFSELGRKVAATVGTYYPQDLLSSIHPQVNKAGVAAHRLGDPDRPRFDSRGNKK